MSDHVTVDFRFASALNGAVIPLDGSPISGAEMRTATSSCPLGFALRGDDRLTVKIGEAAGNVEPIELYEARPVNVYYPGHLPLCLAVTARCPEEARRFIDPRRVAGAVVSGANRKTPPLAECWAGWPGTVAEIEVEDDLISVLITKDNGDEEEAAWPYIKGFTRPLVEPGQRVVPGQRVMDLFFPGEGNPRGGRTYSALTRQGEPDEEQYVRYFRAVEACYLDRIMPGDDGMVIEARELDVSGRIAEVMEPLKADGGFISPYRPIVRMEDGREIVLPHYVRLRDKLSAGDKMDGLSIERRVFMIPLSILSSGRLVDIFSEGEVATDKPIRDGLFIPRHGTEAVHDWVEKTPVVGLGRPFFMADRRNTLVVSGSPATKFKDGELMATVLETGPHGGRVMYPLHAGSDIRMAWPQHGVWHSVMRIKRENLNSRDTWEGIIAFQAAGVADAQSAPEGVKVRARE